MARRFLTIALVLALAAGAAWAQTASDDGATGSSDVQLARSGNTIELLTRQLWSIWASFIEYIPALAAGVLVIIGTSIAGRIVSAISDRLLGRTRMRGSLQELARRFLVLAAWATGLTIAAMVLFEDLTPSKALAALGIGSIAVGFAFKDIFENFFAGVLILWRFPFENGDFIKVEGIEGKVEDVTVRNTLLRRVSGELVVIPNATIFKNPAEVQTNRPVRRVTIFSGVAYGEDVDQARQVITDAVSGCETVDKDHPVEIFAHEFADSSINFEVAWWTQPTPLDIRRSRDKVVSAIKRALDKAGIEIPFPYRTLTFKEPLETVSRGGGQ